MKKTINVMSIGDIHGRNSWKEPIFGNGASNYETWRREFDNGASEAFIEDYPILRDMDKIIFVGDYVDSFDVSNVIMKQNLEDLIHFKKAYPEKVVLLIGNHDVQYIVPDQICSGYRPEMKYDFGQLFKDNAECFQFAYYLEDIKTKRRFLWTHAGVTQGWLTSLKRVINNDRFRFKSDFEGMDDARIDVLLNKAWEYRLDVLFTVDSDSGGMSQWAGPVWVRPRRLIYEAAEGYDQIIGHTPQRSIVTRVTDRSTDADELAHIDTIYLIDCLEHGDGNVLKQQLTIQI